MTYIVPLLCVCRWLRSEVVLRLEKQACDEVLDSVEAYLSNFQTDLGAVAAEIENLQTRSLRINLRLDNRIAVERLLGPTVGEVSVSPVTVGKIYEGPVDSEWVLALAKLEEHSDSLDAASKKTEKVKALEDLRPLVANLIDKAVEMIRDYLVGQIRSLRSPNINAQFVQLNTLLNMKALYKFIARHNVKLSEEIGQAYINTMRWYYLHNFSRYLQSLEKMKLHTMERQGLVAQNEPVRRSGKEFQGSSDALTLGNRRNILRLTSPVALPAHLAEESLSTHYLETSFRHFNLALVDNASAEYLFLAEFFSTNTFHQVSRKFTEVFGPTFEQGHRYTKALLEGSFDCLGVLLCVRLNQAFAFELQRRKIPVLDSYINGTNMLLWPRFQVIMDLHCDSIRKATASIPTRSGAALSLAGPDTSKQSAAPHALTQRFGQFLQSILLLSGDTGDDEPISNSLRRLRGDFDAFLVKSGRTFSDVKKRERFLQNNYALILTIISDTSGRLAEEQKTVSAGKAAMVDLQR
ncbi:MAG: hypothetical protein M1826_002518 [Phylliscum demangeonii]|nr:MAG: hypothetical protein M1826_002518 [Phylliscum demangeonii]